MQKEKPTNHQDLPCIALQPGGQGTLVLTGTVCFDTVMVVYRQGLALIDAHKGDIMVDVKAVSHTDSSILALLSGWIRYTMTQEKHISFVHPSESLKHLMQLSGLEAIFFDIGAIHTI